MIVETLKGESKMGGPGSGPKKGFVHPATMASGQKSQHNHTATISTPPQVKSAAEVRARLEAHAGIMGSSVYGMGHMFSIDEAHKAGVSDADLLRHSVSMGEHSPERISLVPTDNGHSDVRRGKAVIFDEAKSYTRGGSGFKETPAYNAVILRPATDTVKSSHG